MSTRRPLIGVMGAGEGASAAASRGACTVKGHLVVGVLPGDGRGPGRQQTAELDLALFSGMGQARNLINVLSADVVVVCGAGGAGTASEAAHAIKAGRPAFSKDNYPDDKAFDMTVGELRGMYAVHLPEVQAALAAAAG
jgi:uncharacterized protein (TIGR00725 family)